MVLTRVYRLRSLLSSLAIRAACFLSACCLVTASYRSSIVHSESTNPACILRRDGGTGFREWDGTPRERTCQLIRRRRTARQGLLLRPEGDEFRFVGRQVRAAEEVEAIGGRGKDRVEAFGDGAGLTREVDDQRLAADAGSLS